MTFPAYAARTTNTSGLSPHINSIRILARPEEGTAIGEALRYSRYADVAVSGPDGSVTAVLISDRLDHHLELCRVWAEHHPVLLVSDRRDFAFRLAAARAGVNTVVDRPIDPIDLVASLASAVSKGDDRLTVVLADDDILASELTAEILRASNIDVVVVNDATQVLDIVEQLLPDLILMDVNMPGSNGIELAQVIRLTRRLVAIPILFLSGECDPARQETARHVGGDDFLSKPIDPRALIARVRLRGERARTLRSIIERDALTGLLDRGRFHDRLDYLAKAGRRFSLVLLDIDLFKAINDTHGHAVGDQVIQTLARLLVSGLRREDIVGRCGGEEFGAILLDADDAQACSVVDRIRERFAATVFDAHSTRFAASFSAGVAAAADGVPASDLFQAADQALYAAKRDGRNQLRVATAA